MGINPRFQTDESAIGTLIAFVVVAFVLGAIAITGFAVYQLTQRPDVIYNITDTGFSLAGLGIDTTWIIVGIIGALVVMYLLFKKK